MKLSQEDWAYLDRQARMLWWDDEITAGSVLSLVQALLTALKPEDRL